MIARARPPFGLLIVSVMAACLAGCGAETTDDYIAYVREHCTRYQSRANPRPLPLSEMQTMLGTPERTEQLDDRRQQWDFELADGTVRLVIQLDAGGTWDDADPDVFVELSKIEVL